MPTPRPDPPGPRPSFPGLVAGIALFVLIGIPLTAYVWETLNQLMAGRVVVARALLTLPALALLIGLWRGIARAVQRWDAEQHPGPTERRLP